MTRMTTMMRYHRLLLTSFQIHRQLRHRAYLLLVDPQHCLVELKTVVAPPCSHTPVEQRFRLRSRSLLYRQQSRHLSCCRQQCRHLSRLQTSLQKQQILRLRNHLQIWKKRYFRRYIATKHLRLRLTYHSLKWFRRFRSCNSHRTKLSSYCHYNCYCCCYYYCMRMTLFAILRFQRHFQQPVRRLKQRCNYCYHHCSCFFLRICPSSTHLQSQ